MHTTFILSADERNDFLIYPEDGGNTFFRNVGKFLPDYYTASYSRRRYSFNNQHICKVTNDLLKKMFWSLNYTNNTVIVTALIIFLIRLLLFLSNYMKTTQRIVHPRKVITLCPYVERYIKMGNQLTRTENSNKRPLSLAYQYRTDPKRTSEIEYT